MKNWDKASAGRKIAVSLLALALVLAVAGPASAQSSPAENQYGAEPPAANDHARGRASGRAGDLLASDGRVGRAGRVR